MPWDNIEPVSKPRINSSKRMRIAAKLMVAGCGVFFMYGIAAAVLSGSVAAYQYEAASGQDFAALSESARSFASTLILLIGLMGAGLALCSGALFWYALSNGLRWMFLPAVIGGGLGVASLLTIHMEQKAWALFIVDNVCFTFINLGFMVGGKEILNLALGKKAAP